MVALILMISSSISFLWSLVPDGLIYIIPKFLNLDDMFASFGLSLYFMNVLCCCYIVYISFLQFPQTNVPCISSLIQIS